MAQALLSDGTDPKMSDNVETLQVYALRFNGLITEISIKAPAAISEGRFRGRCDKAGRPVSVELDRSSVPEVNIRGFNA
jgi:hypothetical protein